jgi:hypothetical protein
MNDHKYCIHFIFKNKLLSIKYEYQIPNIKDEIRLSKKDFYVVTKRVFCYDEDGKNRVNIGLKKV